MSLSGKSVNRCDNTDMCRIVSSESESEEEQQDPKNSDEEREARLFKIAPKVNSKRSVPREKLKVKKPYGLFSRAYTIEEVGSNIVDPSGENDGDDEDEDEDVDEIRDGNVNLRVLGTPLRSAHSNQGASLADSLQRKATIDTENRRRTLAYRPAHRIPIKQQLEERLAEKKKAGKDHRRMLKEKLKKQQLPSKSPSRRSVPTAVVVVDNSEVDFSEYKRFGTPIDLTKSDSDEIDISEYQRYE